MLQKAFLVPKGTSHSPACYLSFCCCASLSTVWLPLLSILPLGSCNRCEVSPFPPLPKAEQPIALHLSSFALCSNSSHHRDFPMDSFLYDSLSSAGSPNLRRAHQEWFHQYLGRIPPGILVELMQLWVGGCCVSWVHSSLLAMFCSITIWGSFLQTCSLLVGPSLSYCRALSVSESPLWIGLFPIKHVGFPSAIYKASLPSSTLSVILKHSKHTVQSFIQKALMKAWNWTSPVVTSWGILFLTSHQLDLVLTSPPLEPGTAANFPPISFHTQPISHLFACKECIRDLEKGFAKAKVYNTCSPPLFHTEVHVIVENNQGGWPEFALGTSLWLSYS